MAAAGGHSMGLITPPGSYKFYDRDVTYTGNVQVNANGTWQWRAHNGMTNSGKWGDVLTFTHFVAGNGQTVAKRSPHEQTFYDSTKPWFNANLNDLGSMSK
jgi:hypothetical protein